MLEAKQKINMGTQVLFADLEILRARQRERVTAALRSLSVERGKSQPNAAYSARFPHRTYIRKLMRRLCACFGTDKGI